jgi:hypothetical protein
MTSPASRNSASSLVEGCLSPEIGLRNELPHPRGPFISDAVRASGEREIRWFAERMGLKREIVPGVGDG